MNLQNKIVLAHKGFFNKNSEQIYRENSKELCEITTKKDYISIIELDVRKSRDGILYCYHGSFWEYFIFLKFPRDFSYMKEKYNVDKLEDILKIITEDKRVLLDLKDKTITREDILKVTEDKKFKEVILGNPSVSFLKRFHDMPSEFSKIFFGNIFCNFYNLKYLRDLNYKYFDVVFLFQLNKKVVDKIRLFGMEPGCFPVFCTRESYYEALSIYHMRRINSDFV